MHILYSLGYAIAAISLDLPLCMQEFRGHAILASTMHAFTTHEAKSMGFLV